MNKHISNARREAFLAKIREQDGHWYYPGKSGKVPMGESGVTIRAYRFAWLITHECEAPKKLENICGDRKCCNPKHWRDAAERQLIAKSPVDEVKWNKSAKRHYVRNKITGGKTHWLTPDESRSHQLWLSERAYLMRGVQPPRRDELAMTLSAMSSLYCDHLLAGMEAEDITLKHAKRQKNVAAALVAYFGRSIPVCTLTPADFTKYGQHLREKSESDKGYRGEVNKTKTVFRWAYNEGHLQHLPKWGTQFPIPAVKLSRVENRKRRLSDAKGKADAMFTAAECRAMLNEAPADIKAWIYLGLNAGLGNYELAILKDGDIWEDASGEFWFDQPRIKTGGERMCHVWGETVDAVRKAAAERPVPHSKEYQEHIFLSPRGHQIVTQSNNHDFCERFRAVMVAADCYVKRRGFYALRHTFKTVASECVDHPAVGLVMGHVPPENDMAAAYTHEISDERLKVVSATVKAWLEDTTSKTEHRQKNRISMFT